MTGLTDIAELALPGIDPDLSKLEARFPKRELPLGAQVTRFAPSPTGFLHTGSLFTAMIAYRLAKQSGGVYIFRVEDTDTKRTIAGSDKELLDQLINFGIVPDEGWFPEGDKGIYGPYRQSLRADIYKAAVKSLLLRGKAYVDFATPEDLAKIKEAQEASRVLPGYYGIYARDRNLPLDEVAERMKAGEPWVIRYRSEGDHNQKTSFVDLIRGKIELQDNDMDIVILKRDGLPTYHFAHVVDDHLMGTTVVSRGEEWIPSTPVHLQLFKDMGWESPRYAHLPVIMKLDHGNKRKLSKRKDPEASVGYFQEQGYSPKAVMVYLMSIANSNFEEWTMESGDYDTSHFDFSFEKMSLDGALFDIDKLNYFSREVLAREKGMPLVEEIKAWAKAYSPTLLEKIERDPEYFSRCIDIEKERQNPRKDYAKYSDIENSIRFFYDDEFEKMKAAGLPFDEKYDKAFVKGFLKECEGMDYEGDETAWFSSIKEIAGKNGFALANKEYKANPDAYKGNMADAAGILRVAITGSRNSPNLHEVISILGKERTIARLNLD